MDDKNDKIYFTAFTEKAALLKAVGYSVEVEDKTNPYKVYWRCEGEINGVAVKEASRKIHQGISLGKIIELEADLFALQKYRPALRELMGQIAEIKREAGVK